MVLITFLVIQVITVGVLSVVMSDLHGAAANQMAMQATHVAEAGLNYGVSQLVAKTSDAVPGDERYAGEPNDVVLAAEDGSSAGTFRVIVRCVYPREAIPPSCQDDPLTAAVDEHNFRVIRASGFVPGRPGRARRQIEALVRRYAPGPSDTPVYGVCGREGVELGPETTLVADVGSNGSVRIDGPRRNPGTLRERLPRSPLLGPIAQAVGLGSGAQGMVGLYAWRVTFVDFRGDESGGSSPTQPLLLNGQYAYLTSIPVGDSSITRRRIYRSPQGSPRGPWFLVGEVADNVTRQFTDRQTGENPRNRIPGGIGGNVTAGGTVLCSRGCANQVDGQVRSGVRDVVCPNFLLPQTQPDREPARDPIIQSAANQTVRWGALHVPPGEGFTIQTLSEPDAELHIHLGDVYLERGATIAITGLGTVYFHINGSFVLGPGAVFGAVDFYGNLIQPSDRVQVLIGARDPSFGEAGVASVRLERDNRVSALLFAPNANILVDRAEALNGALYGRYVRLTRSAGIVLDPVEGLGSEKSGVRPSPFQYLMRWYDNPNPSP